MPRKLIIDDENWKKHVIYRDSGVRMGRGLVQRDMARFPVGYCAAAPAWSTDIKLIPRSEWSARIKEMEETKTRLSDIRNIGNKGRRIESLNQGSEGYCWAYAPTSALTVQRAVQGLIYRRLSAHAIGCLIKGYRNQGGWGAQALDFIKERGVPDVQHWAERSMSRSNDKPETWQNAAKHKATEGFVELSAPVYDRDLSFDQKMTLLLNRIPVASDYMWWTHAVCDLDPVEVEPGSFGVRIWNSWGDSYGTNGMAVLRGTRAISDNAVAPRVATSA